MTKFKLILVLLIVSFRVMAAEQSVWDQNEEAQVQTMEGTEQTELQSSQAITYFESTSEEERAYTDLMKQLMHQETSIFINGVEVDDRCQSFVGLDSKLGPDGLFVIQELTNNAEKYQEVLNADSMSLMCPQYRIKTTRQKAMIWMLAMTAMVHFESNCSPTARAKGPNGTAQGYLQLHKGHETEYDGTENACVHNASMNTQDSIRCGLGMLNLQMKNSGGELFWSKSYWDVLRPNGEAKVTDKIRKIISNSRACKLEMT